MDISQVDLDRYTPSEQSTEGCAMRCGTHGKIHQKRFMMPKPNSYGIADYVCATCFDEKFPEFREKQQREHVLWIERIGAAKPEPEISVADRPSYEVTDSEWSLDDKKKWLATAAN